MGPFSLTRTILYGVGIFLSLLVLAISAGASAKTYGVYSYWDGAYGIHLSIYRGLVAFGVLSFIYFTVSTVLGFLKVGKPFSWVMVDTIILGVLFFIGLGTSAWPSSVGGGWNSLGAASLAFGWLTTFLILAILILVVVYTLTRHGGSMDAWQTTLDDLENYGGQTEKGAGYPTPGALEAQQPPMTATQQPPMTATQQPVVQQQPQQAGFVVQPSTDGTTYPPQQLAQQPINPAAQLQAAPGQH